MCGPRNGKQRVRNAALAKTAKRKEETEKNKRKAEAVRGKNGEAGDGKRPKQTGEPS